MRPTHLILIIALLSLAACATPPKESAGNAAVPAVQSNDRREYYKAVWRAGRTNAGFFTYDEWRKRARVDDPFVSNTKPPTERLAPQGPPDRLVTQSQSAHTETAAVPASTGYSPPANFEPRPSVQPRYTAPRSMQPVRGVVETQIEGTFSGWSGDTIWKMTNGQIWQQAEYAYHYHYAYRPEVLIYPSRSGWKMKVEDDEEIAVRQLR